jgi:hypothetical protein
MSSTPSTHHASTNVSHTADPVARAVADRLAEEIRAVSGVAGLHGGRFGEVALLYPRHRVSGLRATPTALEVHLVVDLTNPRPLAEIATQVRTLVAGLLDTEVDVHFADATGGLP